MCRYDKSLITSLRDSDQFDIAVGNGNTIGVIPYYVEAALVSLQVS